MCNVPIKTGDGARAAREPLAARRRPPARCPTVLTVTGYNKDTTNPTGQACSGEGGIATADTSLADKGYAVMLVDDRGTGASQGKWDSWGERTQLDYRDVLDWIQAAAVVERLGRDDRRLVHGHHLAARRRGRRGAGAAPASRARSRRSGPTSRCPTPTATSPSTAAPIDAGFIPLWLGLTSSAVGAAAVDDHQRPGRLGADVGSTTCANALRLRRPEDRSTHDARPGRRLRRRLLPPALARRPRRPDPRPGRHHRRLVGHLPARRAAASTSS